MLKPRGGLLGRPFADPGQRAHLGIDLVPMQHAGRAHGAVEDFSVRRDMDIGCEGWIFLIIIAGVDERHLGKCTLVLVDRIRADRRRRLGDEMTSFAAPVYGEMARTGPGLGGDSGRIVGRQHAGAGIG